MLSGRKVSDLAEEVQGVIDSDDLRTEIDNLLFEIEIRVHELMMNLKGLKEDSKQYDFTDLKVFRASLTLLELILFTLNIHYEHTEPEKSEGDNDEGVVAA